MPAWRSACRRLVAVGSLATLASVLTLAGCAGSRKPAPSPVAAPALKVAPELRPFLLDPLLGYPLLVDPERAQEVHATFEALLVGTSHRDLLASRVAALRLEDPGFAPAVLLGAQLQAADGHCAAALPDLRWVLAAVPEYPAAALLAARCEDLQGDLLAAYEGYRALAASQPVAAQRAAELQPQAVEIVAQRLAEALGQNQPEEARRQLALLEAWAPDDSATLEGQWRVAAVLGDHQTELAVVRRLQERFPEDLGLLERWAELELELGDPTTAVQVLRRLTEAYPEDAQLADRLDAAKFRWRLSMAPPEVSKLADRPVLSRADFALLLYSLMPGVRSARPEGARIAADILEHPQQAQIAQVINLGLMQVDESVHRFGPYRPVSYQDVLRGLLAALALQSQPPACLGLSSPAEVPRQGICPLALSCQLVATAEECQPRREVSGAAALELLRRSLRLLG